jgi:hypothetical protein
MSLLQSRIAKVVFVYIIIFVLFSVVFLLLFQLPFETIQSVLFYRGLIFLVLTTLAFLVSVYYFYRKNSKLVGLETLFAAVVLTTSLHLSFFVVFPVTFERSVSMYLLTQLNDTQTNKSCTSTKVDLQNKLINDYVIARGAIGKRLTEQKVIDFIEVDGECVSLKKKAKSFLDFSKVISNLYSIK